MVRHGVGNKYFVSVDAGLFMVLIVAPFLVLNHRLHSMSDEECKKDEYCEPGNGVKRKYVQKIIRHYEKQ